MSAALLSELARLGVTLARDGDRLVVDGPEAVVDDGLLAVVVAAKPALLAALDAAEGGARPDLCDGASGDATPAPSGCVRTPDDPVETADGAERTATDAVVSAPSRPWSCFSCGSRLRSARPAWGDWTCGGCGIIVAGPAETERPWWMAGRGGVAPATPAGAEDRPGVAVTWATERGWIAVREPASGEWHQISYRDAPEVWRRALPRRTGRPTGGESA